METIIDREEDIIEEFSFFDDWMDKYTHLISLGKELEQMIPENKTSENQIKGCQSQVWLNAKLTENGILFEADSDAIITRDRKSVV